MLVMKGKSPVFYKILGFSKWHFSTTLWKAECICGKLFDIDRRRLNGVNCYKSCGCLRNQNTKTFFYYFRRVMFSRISKSDGHWIYESESNQKEIYIRFRGKYYTIQRLFYMFWNHLDSIPKGLIINNFCGNRYCICPSHLRVLTSSEQKKINWMKKKNEQHD